MQDQHIVLTLSGEYDVAQRPALRSELENVVASPGLVVDLSGVTFIDSSCIGELLAAHSRRVEAGFGPLSVVQNDLVVKRLFELLGLDLVFRVADALEDVLPAEHGAILRQYATAEDPRPSEKMRH